MNRQPTLDDVLHELTGRAILCGMATLPGGNIRAWIEVDGALVEGVDFDPSGVVSDEVASWLKETADRIHGARPYLAYGELPDLVTGVLPDNVVDARSRFLRRRKMWWAKEAFTP